MGTDLETKRQGVAADELVDTVWGDRVVHLAGAVVANPNELDVLYFTISISRRRRTETLNFSSREAAFLSDLSSYARSSSRH